MTPDKFKAIEARDADDHALADTLRQVAAVTDDKDLRATIDMIADRRALLEYVRELRKVMEHYGMETEHSCMCQFVNDTDTLASECYYHETIRKERDELRAALASAEAEILALRESVAALESREVCTVAHDGDVTTCGYCQRDALATQVEECDQQNADLVSLVLRLRDWQRRAVDVIQDMEYRIDEVSDRGIGWSGTALYDAVFALRAEAQPASPAQPTTAAKRGA